VRAKIIIPVLAVASIVVFLAIALPFGPSTQPQPSPVPEAPATSVSANPSTPVRPVSEHRPVAPAVIQPRTQPESGGEEQRSEAARERAAKLQQIGSTRDADSLNTVSSELNDADASVRRAAVAAAVEIGDRGIIPALQQAMEGDLEPQEKVKIQQAINFLQLPTLTEVSAGQNAGQRPASSDGD
jgi:hypothetical protein